MFFTPGLAAPQLDRRIIEAANSLEAEMLEKPEILRLYHQRYTTKYDPPILDVMQDAYRRQVLYEIARKEVHEQTPRELLWQLFGELIPALVRHYQKSRDHEIVLCYASARDKCVDDWTIKFLDYYAELCVRAGWSMANGGSSTGGMGAASLAWRKQIKEYQKYDVNIFGSLLGMLVDLNEPPSENIHFKSPPLYTFLLRMYYLALLGGNPKRRNGKGNGNGESRRRADRLGNVRRRSRTILRGGLGTLAEVMADLVEVQLAPYVSTCWTHTLDQPIPRFIFVGNRSGSSREGRSDAELVAVFRDMVGEAIILQNRRADCEEKEEKLGPYADRIAALAPNSRMFYRGVMLQFADMMAAGTVDGKDVFPVDFVSEENPHEAAVKVFAIQAEEREALGEFKQGPMAHRP